MQLTEVHNSFILKIYNNFLFFLKKILLRSVASSKCFWNRIVICRNNHEISCKMFIELKTYTHIYPPTFVHLMTKIKLLLKLIFPFLFSVMNKFYNRWLVALSLITMFHST